MTRKPPPGPRPDLTVQELAEKISNSSPHLREILLRIVDVASPGGGAEFAKNHWLVNQEFYALFGLNLGVYHGLTANPLNKTAFESLLVETCQKLGRVAEKAKSKTGSVDVTIENKNVSLKSEGQIHENIHISKFCELGWGSWESAEDLYFKIHRRDKGDTNRTFESRIDLYDRVLTLRHQVTGGGIDYELLEIPLSVLRRVLEIPLEVYARGQRESTSRTTPKSFNIRIPWCDGPGAREILVKFDGGSEQKLTLTLPRECAELVAKWRVDSKAGSR